MKLHIHVDDDADRRSLRWLVTRYTSKALRGMRWMRPRVKLTLSQLDGAAGGLDKRCDIELKSSGRDTVTMTSFAKDWRTALEHVVKQARRRMAEIGAASFRKREQVPRRFLIQRV